MAKLGETLIPVEGLTKGRPRNSWSEFHLRRLENLGFNGERLTLVKFVNILPDGRIVSDQCESKIWRIGNYTQEPDWQHGIIGNIKGLYAADLSYFIKYRIRNPLLLLDMRAEHFVETDGQVVVASAYKTLDILEDGLSFDMKDAYEIAHPRTKRKLGQATSWKDMRRILSEI